MCWYGWMSGERVVSARREIAAPAARIFDLIADPARQPDTYDWTRLADAKRLERARNTTAGNLRASIGRLAVIAEIA